MISNRFYTFSKNLSNFNDILRVLPVRSRKIHLEVVKSDILLYKGDGVSPGSYRMFFHTLDQIVNRTYHRILSIDAKSLQYPDWMSKSSLIIFPGGADTPFVNDLSSKGKYPKGNENIKKFVENGGSYLGICAGSYYGCEYVEFDKNGPLQVIGKRELDFFPGKAVGPAFSGFSYFNEGGARAVRIAFIHKLLNGHEHIQEASCYYHGGGFFIPNDEPANRYEVLAHYSHCSDSLFTSSGIAAVKCYVKDGVAVLCGAHPEYDPDLMSSVIMHPLFIEMGYKHYNLGRRLFMMRLLEECNIRVNHTYEYHKHVDVDDFDDDRHFHNPI